VIDKAESLIKELGFRQVRVRHHGDVARIEIAADELSRALDPRMAQAMSSALRSLGFKYVALDLDGYRMGSLNDALDQS
jgi:uncharacterized protein